MILVTLLIMAKINTPVAQNKVANTDYPFMNNN
jgi:hypothetical protein